MDRRLQLGLAAVALCLCGGPGWAVETPPQALEEDLSARAPMPPPGFLKACLGLIEQQRYAEARELLAPVVSNHPGWARAHFYLALTHYYEHRYGAARELFARALVLDPQYGTVRFYHGFSLYYLGELEAARRELEAFVAGKPDYADAHFVLGLIDFDEDALEQARSRFERAIALAHDKQDRGTEARARARLADVHLRNGELAKARTELERSLALNPDNYEPYFKLSRVLYRLGDTEGAARARARHDEVRDRRRPRPAPSAQP